jgi:hypothetical protein
MAHGYCMLMMDHAIPTKYNPRLFTSFYYDMHMIKIFQNSMYINMICMHDASSKFQICTKKLKSISEICYTSSELKS